MVSKLGLSCPRRFAPAGTPADIVRKLSAETKRAVTHPDVAQKLRDLGAQPVGSAPEEFAAFVRSDTEKWRKVAQAAGVTN